MHAAFTLAFHGFLRIGEVAANSKSDIQPSVLRRSDVELGSMGGPGVIIINFCISKNNQFGSPQTVVVASQLNSILYPVLALQSYLQQAGDATTLFAHFDKSPITRFQFNEILKKTVNFSNIPGKQLFKSHSFRIGAAIYNHTYARFLQF